MNMDTYSSLPEPKPDGDSIRKSWHDSHDVELKNVDDRLESIKDSFDIRQATGIELDLKGKKFGVLGLRRGRDDDDYRAYLLGLNSAFEGRGTKSGVELAIATGILTSSQNVDLIQDFDKLEYEVVLYDWQPHSSTAIRELAELADPVSVDQREPVHNILSTNKFRISTSDTVINSGTELETLEFTISTGDTQNETLNGTDTFGTGRFNGEDTFS